MSVWLYLSFYIISISILYVATIPTDRRVAHYYGHCHLWHTHFSDQQLVNTLMSSSSVLADRVGVKLITHCCLECDAFVLPVTLWHRIQRQCLLLHINHHALYSITVVQWSGRVQTHYKLIYIRLLKYNHKYIKLNLALSCITWSPHCSSYLLWLHFLTAPTFCVGSTKVRVRNHWPKTALQLSH